MRRLPGALAGCNIDAIIANSYLRVPRVQAASKRVRRGLMVLLVRVLSRT
jgi:hypothetical protein